MLRVEVKGSGGQRRYEIGERIVISDDGELVGEDGDQSGRLLPRLKPWALPASYRRRRRRPRLNQNRNHPRPRLSQWPNPNPGNGSAERRNKWQL
jgi:hypothetical protein